MCLIPALDNLAPETSPPARAYDLMGPLRAFPLPRPVGEKTPATPAIKTCLTLWNVPDFPMLGIGELALPARSGTAFSNCRNRRAGLSFSLECQQCRRKQI